MGIGTAFTALGWVLALLLAWTAVSCTARVALVNMPGVRHRIRSGEILVPDAGMLLPELCGSASLALLVLLGALTVMPFGLLAVLLLAAALLPAGRLVWRASRLRDAEGKSQGGPVARRVIRGMLRIARTAHWFPAADLRLLTGRRRTAEAEGHEQGQYAQPAPVQRPVRQAPPPAPVPQAPRPAPPPAPEDAGPAAAAMSPGWAALCAEIGGFEGDTDEEILGFLAAQLAGHLGHAGAVRDLADRLLHGTGLDPAFAQGVAEYADENADMTGGVAMLDRQFHAIYDTLRAWADEHPMGMPHRAREFLQGGEPPLPEAGDDGMAA